MKIKTVKKMRLDELIKHIYENDEKNRIFIDDGEQFAVHSNSSCAAVNIEHLKGYGGKKCISKRDTFIVEVEEELTEDTEFEELWESYWDFKDSKMMTRSMSARMRIGDDVVSINGIKPTNGDIFKTVAIFYKDTLIWSAESGIPEEGVLEVDVE